jgi:hypothetical protein
MPPRLPREAWKPGAKWWVERGPEDRHRLNFYFVIVGLTDPASASSKGAMDCRLEIPDAELLRLGYRREEFEEARRRSGADGRVFPYSRYHIKKYAVWEPSK